MGGLPTTGEGISGAVLGYAVLPGQNGWQAIKDLTSADNPLAHLQIAHAAATLVATAGPYVLLVLLVPAVLIILYAAKVIIRAFAALFGKLHTAPEQDSRQFYELTFPQGVDKPAFATSQLYTVIREATTESPKPGFRRRNRVTVSLELAASRSEGIRYIVSAPASCAEVICGALKSYLPALKIRRSSDYLSPARGAYYAAKEFRLSAEFALPLKFQGDWDVHDPVAYLTGQMTQLAPDELVALQVTISPAEPHAHPSMRRRTNQLMTLIVAGLPISPELTSDPSPNSVLAIAQGLLLRSLLSLLEFVAFALRKLLTGASHSNSTQIPATQTQPSPYELELSQLVKTKLEAPMFEASVRICALADSQAAASTRVKAVATSFALFRSPHQSLTSLDPTTGASASMSSTAFPRRKLAHTKHRGHLFLAAAELADLYHFPSSATRTAGLSGDRSPVLEVPRSLSAGTADLDVLIGVNGTGRHQVPVGMTLDQRRRHTYIIGKTGTGKTTMLTSSIYQDMVAGHGMAVLDPHGDMFHELLRYIPYNRRDDVVVFDPSDRQWPIGLNLLDPGIAFGSEDEARDQITSSVVSVFQKMSNEARWGDRMEQYLRNATMTALYTDKPTLYTIQRLLTEKTYQQRVAQGLADPVLRQFWLKDMSNYLQAQLAAATAPLTHRLGQFMTSKMSRHILLQQETSLRIQEIMDSGKILLVNLSKGELGEDYSAFFGTVLVSLIWTAAYQRTKVAPSARRDFFVYVDEFQNFATPRFAEITSEGRKFRVSLIASHQNVAQIGDSAVLKVLTGNASTLISLAASPDDEAVILPYMAPEVRRGDILNLPPHHFYMKTHGAISESAYSGQTVPLGARGSAVTAAAVVAASRTAYATPKQTVERKLEALLSPDRPPGADTKPNFTPIQPTAQALAPSHMTQQTPAAIPIVRM